MPLVDPACLAAQWAREGLTTTRWSNAPHAVYGGHEHPCGKLLVVVSGSVTLSVDGGRRVVPMMPGDRLELSPRIPHSAVVGPEVVVCLEAPRTPSTRSA